MKKQQVVDHCSSVGQAIKKGYLAYEPATFGFIGKHKQTEFTVLIISAFDIPR